MALTKDRATIYLASEDPIDGPVAASTRLYGGGMVGMNTSGYLVAASALNTLRIVGFLKEQVDNSAGGAGDLHADIHRGPACFANSAEADAIADADRGSVCYVVDNETVAKTSDSGARPVAGTIVKVDSDGVWVEFYKSHQLDVQSGTFTPIFTTGTNCTGAGTPVGYYTRIGKTVQFAIIVPDVVCTAGAPTVSAFDLSLPVASNFAATTDLAATVSGEGVTLGRASADTTNDRIDVNFSATGGAASNDVLVTGQYQIL